MKKILKVIGMAFVIVVVLLATAAIFVSPRVNPGLSFGYYGQYNIAKNAIRHSACVDSVKDYVVQTDLFSVKRFIFTVRTKSGRSLRLYFAKGMDISQACEHPKGFIYYGTSGNRQIYDKESLSAMLKDKGMKIENVSDLLCHIDDVEMIVEAPRDKEMVSTNSQDNPDIGSYLAVDLRPE